MLEAKQTIDVLRDVQAAIKFDVSGAILGIAQAQVGRGSSDELVGGFTRQVIVRFGVG